MRAAFLLLYIICTLVLPGHVVAAAELPWVVIAPRDDTRDEEMRVWDESDSRWLVGFMNTDERIDGAFAWSQARLEDLLKIQTPFAEMRIDPVRPAQLAPEEKAVLAEWFRRGGFLMLLEDAYPYEQEEFRKLPGLPITDFLLRELPEQDADFSIARLEEDHEVFGLVHPSETSPWLLVEMRDNPHYRGRTYLQYKGRMVALCLSRYNVMRQERWVPKPRPFSQDWALDERSYHLVLNIYAYVTMK